ncbi:MAG: ABC transporter ATP-binding protein [Planctomycetes bacterium]|nr:ABC transporter ATP-binding protein [Planctomycetota bacterium]
MIEAEDLRKSYGDLHAVNGISLRIERGEAFGLLGPNGAGKTTTLHMLAGAIRPDSGSVSIDGERDPTRSEVRNAIGIAPQDLAIYEELTAEENLRFFAKLYGLAGSRLGDRVAWGLEFAGLTDRRKDHAGKFSGGMKRRLNLACALVHEPRVLFCDEPTVGVDPQSRAHIFDRIEEVKRAGCTLVYTTHYMEEAQRLCDRVAIVDRGKVLADDSVDALIREYGGQSVVEAEFTKVPDDATSLPGEFDDTTLRIQTSEPFAALARLGDRGAEIAQLRVERPDLERVFLHLTGRRLRD